MAETAQKKITLNNFFEQIVEINKISQKALKKSDESLSVSEKTKIDLERLIQLLKVDFNKETENIIREDATEDRELRDSFLQLQSSFNDLSGAIGIIRKDLDSLTDAFLQSQNARRSALKQRDRQISKEEDTLQKEQILGQKSGGKISSTDQDYKRSVEQKENKALSALKGLLGGGLLAGLGGLVGGEDPPGPSTTPSFDDITADTPEEKALLQTIRKAEGGKSYGTVFGGGEVSQLAAGELTVQEVINMGNTGKLPDRLGGGQAAYKLNKQGLPESGATGAYQYMPDTLQDLVNKGVFKLDEKFTPELQDRGALYLSRRRGVDPTKRISDDDVRKLGGEWAAFPGGGYGQERYTEAQTIQMYNDFYNQQVKSGHQKLRQQLEAERPGDVPRSEAEAKEIEERHKKLREQALSPQAAITPQKREGVPDLQKPSASIASVTLPPVSGGTQQVSGGQGRGEAATNSYGVKSTSNNMMFAQVLSGSFADKMNIAV